MSLTFDQLLEDLEKTSALSALTSLQMQRLPKHIPSNIHVTVVWKKSAELPEKIENCKFRRAHDNTWIVKISLKNVPIDQRPLHLVKTLTLLAGLLQDEVPTISGLESLSILASSSFYVSGFSDDEIF
jgi:hypothetical protein